MTLQINSIAKSYGNNKILKDISITIPENSFHVILGPSGCGKSTLLSIISGITRHDTGSIHFKGRRIDTISARERNIGFVFQDYSLFPHLNVYENIAYGLRAMKTDKNDITRSVKKYLNITGMTMYRDLFPGELSGGQKQRVALARALIMKPSIMLFDEPLSHLDPSLNEQLKKDLLDIQKEEQFTAIYVTHNMDEAFDLASSISILNNGIIEQTDEPDAIHHNPSTIFVASFMGIKNLFPCRVTQSDDDYSTVCLNNDYEEIEEINLYTKNYPVFKQKKTFYISIHPEQILIDHDSSISKNSLNGIVESSSRNGFTWSIAVNINGKLFHVKSHSEITTNIGDTIKLSIPPEAIHPLCGRISRRPAEKRECRCNGLSHNTINNCGENFDKRKIDNIRYDPQGR